MTTTLEQQVEAINRQLNALDRRLKVTPEYYKLSEVAVVTSVTSRTVYTWVTKGELPEYVIDGVKRVKRSELDDFMDRHRVVI
ncbi:helix-turn-helix domain-containing protein [Lactiplantibacillus nangangensis]|uniref:Helix-turn-helix domain-containing protein n=1 Tax=Lactiplantibacillus nangangensis TaxID=2559917 RepID=A0ABW1SK05_9LACO|nr:helix-turn-helix domain-containing protein [Lactiplantibacillus nangangensis]